MTRQELLVEQYEDALFALIMDKVAEVEGQKAIEENQRLKASGEVAIPEELNRRCKQTIRCKTAEKHLKRYGKGFGKVLTRSPSWPLWRSCCLQQPLQHPRASV